MTRAELLQTAKPILFNTKMVRAILDGRKTVTRRVIKPQPCCNKARDCRCPACTGEVSEACWAHDLEFPKKPYNVGNILYVRETWCKYSRLEDDMVTAIEGTERYYYRADGENPTAYNMFLIQRDGHDEYLDYPKWHPSIHMPKEAARIFLRVTRLGVERLQDISIQDLKNEGVLNGCYECEHRHDCCGEDVTLTQDCRYNSTAGCHYPKNNFGRLWNSTVNKKDLELYGWNANPWVWVIEFEKVEVQE